MAAKLSFTVLLVLIMVSMQCINCKYIIKGKVIFQGKPPQELPLGSKLTVKVEDTSLMDAPSKVLNKTEITITDYKKEDGLSYSVSIDDAALPNGISGVADISVSAIINVGWQPSASSSEWLRKGDYLTDTHTRIKAADHDTSIEQNVPVKLYE